MQSIANAIAALETSKNSLDGQIALISKQLSDVQAKLLTCKANKDLYVRCVEVLNIIQQSLQEKTRESFEQVVTNALQSVFKKDFKLKLEFDRRGSLPELNVIVQNAEMQEAGDLENSNSGMALDLISLTLRLIILNFINQSNAPLFLDEAFSQSSHERKLAACEFIKLLAGKFNRQILLINHVSGQEEKAALEFIADNVIQIGG